MSRRASTALAVLAVLALGLTAWKFASAQSAASCPPPLKLAAGACVRQCPAGYEDRGPVCIYRNLSR